MESVLLSIQPYWVFLIIARIMGWNVPTEKSIEVRKDFPKDKEWNKITYIYCSKNRESFNRIPKEYHPLMERFLGKVFGEFVCDWIEKIYPYSVKEFCANGCKEIVKATCLSDVELANYAKGKPLYFWHISDLKIYDKPKELSEFKIAFHCFNLKNVECKTNAFGYYVLKYHENSFCRICKYYNSDFGDCDKPVFQPLKRPPQSWCYVESLGE